MGNFPRRRALGMTGAAVWAVNAPPAEPAMAATSPEAPADLLKGKICVVIGPDDQVSAAVRDGLAASSATVRMLPILPSNESAWAEALVNGPRRPVTLDVIVNVCIPERGGTFGKVDMAEFRRVIDANYTRTFLALKYGTQALKASGGGALINVTSNAGQSGAPNSVARCAAAHGIVLMTRSAALASAADGVRVNALLAGEIAKRGAKSPGPGQVSPETVASAVTFLAADASKYFTGLIMPVDNGGAAR